MRDQPVKPDTTAGLDAWLSYLEALHPSEIDLGLERVSAVAERLAVTHPQAKVFTVAGTNGKGSTVRYLETILRAAGYSTGVYISPHLYHYNERVRINGDVLTDQQHVAAFAAVEKARGDTSLTYFEFGTLAAFWLMQQQQLDVWILEVGLGGRLDAVNCIDADVSVLTSVGIDHIGFLGDNRTDIAREKAGVFRPHRPAVIGEPDFPRTVEQQQQALGVHLIRVDKEFNYALNADTPDNDTNTWLFQGEKWRLPVLPVPQLPLPNAATALAALEQSGLKVSQQAIEQGLKTAREAGRLQFLPAVAGKAPDRLLDVAHNPHAAKFLREHVQTHFADRPILLVIGMLKDKDIAGTLAELKPLVHHWYCATLSEPRGCTAAQLCQQGQLAADTPKFDSVLAAYKQACEDALTMKQQKPLVLVCGSFYTVGKIITTE